MATQFLESKYTPITAAAPTTTVVATGKGVLTGIIINTPAGTGVITIYDNTAASGTKIGTITMPATLLSDGPHVVSYPNVTFAKGLTIVTSTAAQDITVCWMQ